jgi:hypothetical protein
MSTNQPPLEKRNPLSSFISILIGSLVFLGFSVIPLFKFIDVKGWNEISCVVISFQVKSHSGGPGVPTYSVDILYSYEINGKEYQSNRYNVMAGKSSSGRSGKAAIVNRYPPGTETPCYVNPNDLTDAVIDRGFPLTLLVGFIGLIFVGVGTYNLFKK